MIHWGVRVEGSYVVRCYDGPSAFREEKAWREERRREAQVVVSRDGGETWWVVPWGSTVRPDPAPPRRPTVRPQSRRGWVRLWRGVLTRCGVGMRPDSVRVGPVFRRWLGPEQ